LFLAACMHNCGAPQLCIRSAKIASHLPTMAQQWCRSLTIVLWILGRDEASLLIVLVFAQALLHRYWLSPAFQQCQVLNSLQAVIHPFCALCHRLGILERTQESCSGAGHCSRSTWRKWRRQSSLS
jgi:hypothetical protein